MGWGKSQSIAVAQQNPNQIGYQDTTERVPPGLRLKFRFKYDNCLY